MPSRFSSETNCACGVVGSFRRSAATARSGSHYEAILKHAQGKNVDLDAMKAAVACHPGLVCGRAGERKGEMSKLKSRDPMDVEEPYDSNEGDLNYRRIHPKGSIRVMWLYDEARGPNDLEYEIWKDLEKQYWAEWMRKMPQESLGFFETLKKAEEACERHYERSRTS
jgi:hypothetical protein